MSQIQKGETFADGQVVTYDRLNDLVDSAILLPPVINGQTALSPLTGNEETLIYDPASLSLKKCLLKNALLTGNDISTGLISNAIGGVTINGWTEVRLDAPNIKLENYATVGSSIDLNTHSSIQLSSSSGNINFSVPNGNITFTSTRSIRLPVGTTAQRPATPVAGEIRFNSTTSQTETYNGSSWSSGYVLSEVVEETVSPTIAISVANTYVVLFTSASYTKSSNEIWRIEIVGAMQYNIYQYLGFKLKRTSGSVDLIGGWLVDQGFAGYDHCVPLNLSAVENVGTSFTSTFTFEMGYTSTGYTLGVGQIVNTNPATTFTIPATKFRIYKYKSH